MDGQHGGTLRHCIIGIAIAFIFGHAYVIEMRYSDLHSEIKIREAELASMKQKTKDLESKVETFERKYKRCEDKFFSEEKEKEDKGPVVFNAVISKSLDIQRNTPVNVVYDTVLYQTGNAYNPRNGFFTAPSGGLYVFTWSTAVADRKIFDAELLVNGQRKGLGNCNNEGNPGIENCANTIPVVLKSGDEVNIRTTNANFAHGGHWSSFKGWKVW